jgi:hypothetical protein
MPGVETRSKKTTRGGFDGAADGIHIDGMNATVSRRSALQLSWSDGRELTADTANQKRAGRFAPWPPGGVIGNALSHFLPPGPGARPARGSPDAASTSPNAAPTSPQRFRRRGREPARGHPCPCSASLRSHPTRVIFSKASAEATAKIVLERCPTIFVEGIHFLQKKSAPTTMNKGIVRVQYVRCPTLFGTICASTGMARSKLR